MKLKPCPNPACGNADVEHRRHHANFDYIRCRNCGMQSATEESMEEAEEAWNALIRPQWVKWHEFFGCTHPEEDMQCSWCMKGYPEEKQMQGEPPEPRMKTTRSEPL